MNIVILILILILTLVLLFLFGFIISSYFQFKFCFLKYEYWYSTVLTKLCNSAYDEIYGKYIIPFIASSETINMNPKDKYFLEISNIYIETFKRKSGRLWKVLTKCVYNNEDQLIQNILAELIIRLQEDMINSAVNHAKKVIED